ncbi:hypothetical protein BJ165DRAFT_1512276, partial [Panaeolus papilionaceus]
MIREYDEVGVGRGNFGGKGGEGGENGELAVARIKIGDEEQRKYHASIILSSDLEMYEDVKVIYELSGVDLATSGVYAFMQTPPCIKNIGESRDAANVMSMVSLSAL